MAESDPEEYSSDENSMELVENMLNSDDFKASISGPNAVSTIIPYNLSWGPPITFEEFLADISDSGNNKT